VLGPVDSIDREGPGRIGFHFWLSIVSGRLLDLARKGENRFNQSMIGRWREGGIQNVFD
jgi:hypothetical protein